MRTFEPNPEAIETLDELSARTSALRLLFNRGCSRRACYLGRRDGRRRVLLLRFSTIHFFSGICPGLEREREVAGHSKTNRDIAVFYMTDLWSRLCPGVR